MRGLVADKSLESIAGTPRRIFQGVSTSDLAETGDSLAARTLYTLFTVPLNHTWDALQNIAQYGSTTNDAPANRNMTLRINTSVTGVSQVQNRFTGGGGITVAMPTGLHGRHIAYWGINTNRNVFLGLNGAARGVNTSTQLDIPNIRTAHYSFSGLATTRTTLVYDGEHTASQRARIEMWLRNSAQYWPNLLSRDQSMLEVASPAQTDRTWMNYFATQELNTTWSEAGTGSLRVLPAAASNASAVMLGMGQNGTLKGVTPGRTYTLSGSINVEAVQTTGFHATRARRITAFARKTDNSYVELFTTQAANSIGITRVSAVITIPSDANEFFIRLSNGSPNTGENVSFDRIGLYEHGPLGAPPADWWTPGVW